MGQVYTTCGSDSKREFLIRTFPALRPENIGDSRSCSFEALVMRGTQGRGVQLVLNSLADDKLQVGDPILPVIIIPIVGLRTKQR